MLARVIVALTLASATPTYAAGEAEQAIYMALKGLPDTSPRPYWLTVINAFGDKERVAIAFGMMDNLAYCRLLIEAYQKQFAGVHSFCEPLD